MKIEWITDWERIFCPEFQDRWRRLLKEAVAPHVFFSPELVEAWVATYRPLRRLSPRFLWMDSDEGTLLWPLVFWRQNWKNAFRKRLIAVGYSDFDYAEPICSGNREILLPRALEEIGRWRDFDQIDIAGLRESPALEKEVQFCPVCRLDSFLNGEDFLKKAKKSLREDVRRQFNRIREHGESELRSCSLREALGELPSFLEAHRSRWPHAYKAPHLHENLLRMGMPAGIVRFDCLTLDGRSIAWHLGYHFDRRFYYYMPAVDANFQKFSPGKLLLYKLVERAIAEGDLIFDHLRGDENYKSGWTNEIQGLWKFHRRRSSLSGHVKFFLLDKLKPFFS